MAYTLEQYEKAIDVDDSSISFQQYRFFFSLNHVCEKVQDMRKLILKKKNMKKREIYKEENDVELWQIHMEISNENKLKAEESYES